MASEQDEAYHVEWGHHFGTTAFRTLTNTVETAIEAALSEFTENVNRSVGRVVRAELDGVDVSIDVYDDDSTPKITLHSEGLDYARGIPLIPLIMSEIRDNPDFMPQLRAVLRKADEQRLADAEAKAAS